jgi:hypothetical protein
MILEKILNKCVSIQEIRIFQLGHSLLESQCSSGNQTLGTKDYEVNSLVKI